jgi:hypothetical protein
VIVRRKTTVANISSNKYALSKNYGDGQKKIIVMVMKQLKLEGKNTFSRIKEDVSDPAA